MSKFTDSYEKKIMLNVKSLTFCLLFSSSFHSEHKFRCSGVNFRRKNKLVIDENWRCSEVAVNLRSSEVFLNKDKEML